MNKSVLLRFLSSRLIDVGGDDAKLEKLTQTAGHLATEIKNSPRKAVYFSLVALDPDAPTDDPVVHEVIAALREHWPTYVNTFAGTPMTVVRAILLDALVAAARSDDTVGIAFATSARNLLPLTPAGDEGKIWIDVIREVEQKVDARAEAEWTTPYSIKVAQLNLELPSTVNVKAHEVKVDRNALLKGIEMAAGPQTSKGNTDGNQHWPQTNTPWATDFSARLTEVIATQIDAVTDKSRVSSIDFSNMFGTLAKSVSGHVDKSLNGIIAATAGLQRRTNLLWWKEALYSPSAQASYREMPATSAAALMALDLHRQIPTFSPASVAAFLEETVLLLPGVDRQKNQPLDRLLDETCAGQHLARLREAAAELVPPPAGRSPILALIGHPQSLVTGDPQKFRAFVGAEPDAPLSIPAWAVWIFRELQAMRAVAETPTAQESAGAEIRE
jgi:hypothetical protein